MHLGGLMQESLMSLFSGWFSAKCRPQRLAVGAPGSLFPHSQWMAGHRCLTNSTNAEQFDSCSVKMPGVEGRQVEAFSISAGSLEQLKDAVERLACSAAAASAPFEWVDGPLVTAMRQGGMILIDELNLAEDAVLERLNRHAPCCAGRCQKQWTLLACRQAHQP